MHSIFEKTPRLVEKQLIGIRAFSCCTQSYANKKIHWAKAAIKKTHIDRAMDHYDDFYGTVYKHKWPSMRLGLLCDPKYLAFPNTFTGGVGQISESLESLGGLSLENIWTTANNRKDKEREELDSQAEKSRIQKMDETLQKIAQTKKAEELEVLYQNAPRQKLTMENYVPPASTEDPSSVDSTTDSRIIKDIREASQEFISETKLKGDEDFIFESEYYSSYGIPKSEGDSNYEYTTRKNCGILKFPTLLRPYTFEPGNPSVFPSAAKHGKSGLREFICVNGASLAPIIALDLKPDVSFLDLCAGPGTKSLLSLMTSCPSHVVCNDVDQGRLQRVRRLFTEFTGKSQPDGVEFTRYNAANFIDVEFDRVLADVPCSQDRVSCTIADNNIFKPTRTRERLGLVVVQKEILMQAFKSLKQKSELGSCCVYSTCTLSPIENDGAVGAALKETPVNGLCVDVLGLWNALLPFQEAGYFFMSRTKFGVLIEPNIVSNFGPMYISRIFLPPTKVEEETVDKGDNNSISQVQVE